MPSRLDEILQGRRFTPTTTSRVSGATAETAPESPRSTLGLVLDIISRPGRATAGLVGGALEAGPLNPGAAAGRAWQNLRGQREDDFDDVLRERGFEDTWTRRGTGFALDLALDPLNVLPVGKAAKIIGGGAKKIGSGTVRGLEKVGLGGIPRALEASKDALGKTFVPYYDLRSVPDFQRDVRLAASEVNAVKGRQVRRYADRYTGTTPQEREQILRGLETGPLPDPRLEGIRLDQAGQFADEAIRGVQASVLDPQYLKQDYAPYIRSSKTPTAWAHPDSAFSARSRGAKHKFSADIDEAIRGGAEPDAAIAGVIRSIDADVSATNAELAQKAIAKYGTPTPSDPSWRTVSDTIRAEKPLRSSLAGIYFPPPIADYLTKLLTPQGPRNPALEAADKAMAAWRTMATVLRPGFHATNLLGNIYNSALGGLPVWKQPLRYLQAARLPQQVGQYAAPQVREFMAKHGLDNAGLAFGDETLKEGLENELRRRLTPESRLSKLNPLKLPGRYVRGMSNLGGAVENASKRAFFVDQLQRGKSLDDALLATKDALFDYSELTPWERKGLRQMFPFYTFMRKNIPLQVRGLATRPQTHAGFGKLRDSAEDAAEERGIAIPERFRPAYFNEGAFTQLPVKIDDKPAFVSPYLPNLDLNKIPIPPAGNLEGGSSIERALNDVMSGLTPLAKVPLELAQNKQFFTGRQLFDPERGSVRDKRPAIAPLALLGEAAAAAGVDLPGYTVDPKTGRPYVPFWANYAVENMAPIATSAGKALQSVVTPEEAANPLNWTGFVGLPRTQTLSPTQQKQAKLAALRRERKRREAERREQRLETPAERARRLAALSQTGY